MLHKASRTCRSFLRALSALIVMGVAVPSIAQNESILYYFNPVDPLGSGANPQAGLVRDSAGNLYGTAFDGGKYREGAVFELSADGVYSTLYSFIGGSTGAGDGCLPRAALIRDGAGNLYGTTSHCGTTANAGNVFKIDGAGNETILHTFTGGADGAVPLGSLVRDQAGNVYGTTSIGGDASCSYFGVKGCGTIFKISPAGKFILLHTFTGLDGANPQAGIMEDAAGNFYGTTASGGATGWGTLYKLDKTSQLSVLYSFLPDSNPNDGMQPASTPVRDSAGNLYGTTIAGGNFNECSGFGCGIVFKVDTAGNETIVHMFNESDGVEPFSLLIDGKGNLYGETNGDGGSYYGTVFQVDTLGNFKVLHGFGGNGDGIGPCCSLVSDKQGNLYGTTEFGGYANNGVIFKINVPE